MTGVVLRDFLKYQFLSNVQYAPDGKRAAFAVSRCSKTQSHYDSCLWLWDEDKKMSFQLTSGGKEQTYVWEDEEHILFAAYRQDIEENRQEMGWEFTPIYRICVNGGEAVKAFELPVSVRGMRRIDNRYLLILGELNVGEPDLYKAAYLDKKSVWNQKRREEEYEVLDESPFWQNGRGFVNKKRMAVFLYDKEKEDFIRVSEALFDTGSLTVKGQTIYYSGECYDTRMKRREEIWSYHVESRRHICLYQGGEYKIERMEAAGSHVWVFASDEKRYGINENSFLFQLDEKNRKLKLIYKSEESVGNTVSSDCRFGPSRVVMGRPDGSLYLIATRRNASHLLHLTEESGMWELRPLIEKEGAIDGFSVNPVTGDVLLIAMYDDKLQELYQWRQNGTLRMLTSLNREALRDRLVVKPEKMSVMSGGVEIDGWVLKPVDFYEDQKYPAILDIHGGPKTVYGEVFVHEMQCFAGMNYFVFFCNPAGSDGRGNEFADIRGKYGSVDYQNLMDFTDAVLKKYPQIDEKRLAVAGGSYGGFMVNWIVGHTNRFACAISQRSISNWISHSGLSDIGPYFVKDQTQGEVGENIDKLWQQSPLRYCNKVETPVLFIHSDEDYRCPLEQGLQFYTALVERGVPARMCIFKGENHELSRSGKPKHRVRRMTEIMDWLKRWIGDGNPL